MRVKSLSPGEMLTFEKNGVPAHLLVDDIHPDVLKERHQEKKLRFHRQDINGNFHAVPFLPIAVIAELNQRFRLKGFESWPFTYSHTVNYRECELTPIQGVRWLYVPKPQLLTTRSPVTVPLADLQRIEREAARLAQRSKTDAPDPDQIETLEAEIVHLKTALAVVKHDFLVVLRVLGMALNHIIRSSDGRRRWFTGKGKPIMSAFGETLLIGKRENPIIPGVKGVQEDQLRQNLLPKVFKLIKENGAQSGELPPDFDSD